MKRSFVRIAGILLVFGFILLGCEEPKPEPKGDWFDIAVMGISHSAYVHLSESYGFKPNVVYSGNDAKEIFNNVRYHIDDDVGVGFDEKKTYQEIVEILETLGLPTKLVEKAIGSITAYYYISDAGHECAVFVEDTSAVHSRSVMSTGFIRHQIDVEY